ncbi:unnamed protein product [Cuscuta epithymum]|uniref:Uncharacterized protein n=1 Tax=Cuscuta epithymum TaxID=186058 RepID=A0AAV0GLA2_9ASTE|nr:unnamed protein product [Cuscuta epithymum]
MTNLWFTLYELLYILIFIREQIKGASTEMVEYIDKSSQPFEWGALDDIVMEGVSESTFVIDPIGRDDGKPTGVFKENVRTPNNGGGGLQVRDIDASSETLALPPDPSLFSCQSSERYWQSDALHYIIFLLGCFLVLAITKYQPKRVIK